MKRTTARSSTPGSRACSIRRSMILKQIPRDNRRPLGGSAAHGSDCVAPSLCHLLGLHRHTTGELSSVRPQPSRPERLRDSAPNTFRSGRTGSTIHHLPRAQWAGRLLYGGEAYYGRLANSQVCASTSTNWAEDLVEAVRAFLIAGAIRIWRDVARLRPSDARGVRFESRAEAVAGSPAPHSMLFHPSAAISDHFEAAAALLEVTCGLDRETSMRRIATGDRGLPVDAVEQMISTDEARWVAWLDRFAASANAVRAAFDLPHPRRIPKFVTVGGDSCAHSRRGSPVHADQGGE